MAFLTTNKNAGQVDANAESKMFVREVASDGSSVGDTFHDLGWIQDIHFVDDREAIKAIDVGGNQVRKLFTTRTVMLEATLMQSASAQRAFAKTTADKFYQLFCGFGTIDGNKEEAIFSLGNITPKTDVTWTPNTFVTVPFQFEAIISNGTITIPLSSCSAHAAGVGGSASSQIFTITSGEYYAERTISASAV